MISAIITAVIVLGWIGLFILAINLIAEGMFDDHWKMIATGVVLLTGLVSVVIYAVTNDNSPPCGKYETRMEFNAATKTMMPAQYCIQEGQWVK